LSMLKKKKLILHGVMLARLRCIYLYVYTYNMMFYVWICVYICTYIYKEETYKILHVDVHLLIHIPIYLFMLKKRNWFYMVSCEPDWGVYIYMYIHIIRCFMYEFVYNMTPCRMCITCRWFYMLARLRWVVYVYAFMSVYIYIYIYVYVNICMYTYTYIYVYMYIYIYIYLYTYI
jgi:hypothetical protein